MSDFLTRLALRQLGQIATVQPRVVPFYAATPEPAPAFIAETENAEQINERPALQPPGAPGSKLQADVDAPKLQPTFAAAHEGSARAISREPAESRLNETEKAADPALLPPGLSRAETQEGLARLLPARSRESVVEEKLLVVPVVRRAPSAPLPLANNAKPGSILSANDTAAPVLKFAEDNFYAEDRKASEPPVHVTIGRIEVTALNAPAPAKRGTGVSKKGMSLEEYLARRNGRER